MTLQLFPTNISHPQVFLFLFCLCVTIGRRCSLTAIELPTGRFTAAFRSCPSSNWTLSCRIRTIQVQSGQRYWDYVQSLVLLVQTGGNLLYWGPYPGVLCGFCVFCSQFATISPISSFLPAWLHQHFSADVCFHVRASLSVAEIRGDTLQRVFFQGRFTVIWTLLCFSLSDFSSVTLGRLFGPKH